MSIVYFIIVSLSWGLTWYAIKIHAISEVPSIQSIGYRFLLATCMVYLFCWIKRVTISHTWREHLVLAGQGLCMCSMNFYFGYVASEYIPSGLVSVGFSTLVFMNVLNNKLFLSRPVSMKALLGGCLGFLGILLVFSPYIEGFRANQNGMLGLMFCLMAAYTASVGNVLVQYGSTFSTKSILQNMAPTMLYGGIFSIIFSLLQGEKLMISFEHDYIGALLYLVIFGSLIGFASYLKLIKLIGSDKAAYATMVNPIIALIVSIMIEGLHWTLMTIGGVTLILLGSVVVLSKSKSKSNKSVTP